MNNEYEKQDSYENEDSYDEAIVIDNKKNEKFSDIITFQCILCILMAIAFVVLNMTLPAYSQMILDKYRSETNRDSKINQTLTAIVSDIGDFMNSTPDDRI